MMVVTQLITTVSHEHKPNRISRRSSGLPHSAPQQQSIYSLRDVCGCDNNVEVNVVMLMDAMIPVPEGTPISVMMQERIFVGAEHART